VSTGKSNIVLIGMPGSGKSSVGIILAKLLSLDFIDTDVAIQTSEGRSLQSIVDTQGHMILRHIEEKVILGLDCRNHVIATGGSAAYSDAAMRHLKAHGIIVFLDVSLATVETRVHDLTTRGLAKRADQTLGDLYYERLPLYRKYADLVVNCEGLSHEKVCERIIQELRTQGLL
jgi:shikimate kinase